MEVSKAPLSVSKLHHSREKAPRIQLTAGSGQNDLLIRRCNHREIRCERIYPQVVTPLQIDMLNGARECLNTRRRSGAVGKLKIAVSGHEERGAFREIFPPSGRTLARHILSYRDSERAHIDIDCGFAPGR